MPAAPRLALSFLLTLLCATAASAQPWPASGLAVRTNGFFFRGGECLRVTLLALDSVPGPIEAQVKYGFQESLTVTNKNGETHSFARPRVLERRAEPALEWLDAGTSAVLDDTFCFGSNSRPGRYDVTVSLRSAGAISGSLSTCVEFQSDAEEGPVAPGDRCAFAARGVSRRDDQGVLALDGQFPASGLFRLAFLRGDRIVHLMEGGVVASGPGELSFVAPSLGPDGAGVVDLLLQEELSSWSTTLAGVSLLR
jgi:hypothetical protein